MAILSVVVVLVLLTAFLNRTSVAGKMVYKQGSAYGCPFFGVSCKSHCHGLGYNEGYCDGRRLGDCFCSGCKRKKKGGCK
uniref:Defensin n=1 Tax=Rhipicephalus zambeziensis TaxID=60191 RepID=A0A224YDV8_9ACAR